MANWTKQQTQTLTAPDTNLRVTIYQSDVDGTYRFAVSMNDPSGNEVASFDVPVATAYPLQQDQQNLKTFILRGISQVLTGLGWTEG